MDETAFLRLYLFLYIAIACHGYPDLPYFYDIPSCPDNVEEMESVPFYEFDKPQQPFDKRSDFIYYPDFSAAISSEELPPKKEGAVDTPSESNGSRKKRSVELEENLIENVERQENEMSMLPSMLRPGRNNIKTIHLPSSFTPRLGKKRSSERSRENNDVPMSGKAHVINLNAGNAFTPRLGRSEGSNRIQWNAGSAFTPRLGRSEGTNLIRLNAGNAFTPRLGRSSEGPSKIQFNAGSAFTPRLGRSEGPNRIQFNAGSAFTPRLGRSESPNRIVLNAGSSFTPRFG